MSSENNFEIIEELGIIGRNEEGYVKKVVLAKWFDKPPVYEIRTFDPNGVPKKRCGMTPDEFENLSELLSLKGI